MNNIKANRVWMTVSIALLVCLAVYVALYPPVNTSAEPAATVNGVAITKEQLYKKALANGGDKMLDDMINSELIKQEAQKAGIAVSADDVQKELDTVKKSFPSEEQFNQALATYGMTVDDLKSQMETQVQLRKILEPQITITDDQVKQYYDSNLESLKTPEQVKASQIVLSTKEEADAVLADLKNGADFAKTAQEKSIDKESKDNGGDLNYFSKGQMDEALEKAVFATAVGSMTDVIQTDNGFHVMRVTDRKEAYTPTLDEKKAEIHDRLADEQVSALASSWLEKTRAGATIQNYMSKA